MSADPPDTSQGDRTVSEMHPLRPRLVPRATGRYRLAATVCTNNIDLKINAKHNQLAQRAGGAWSNKSLVSGFEFGCVELFVKKGTSLISETVEAAAKTFNQPILSKLRKPIASVRGGTDIKSVVQNIRSHITLITHRFHNAFIDRAHPIGAFPDHVTACYCATHIPTGESRYEVALQ